MPSILEIENLHKSFGGIKAVQDTNFSVERGSITGLIGPNGAGKTTIFNLITGLLKPDRGRIILDGQDIGTWPAYKRAQAGLARSFQMIRIFPNLTVLDNIKVALRKKSEKELEKEALDLLHSIELADKAHLLAGELSYGQQKILEILRATALQPKLMLLDEPAAGINPTLCRQFIQRIREFKKEGKSVLIIEHDMGFIMELCEKIIVMDFGKVIAEGSPQEIQKNPQVLEAYLGPVHSL